MQECGLGFAGLGLGLDGAHIQTWHCCLVVMLCWFAWMYLDADAADDVAACWRCIYAVVALFFLPSL